VLQRCRNWAAQVGEIKVSDDGPNPTISLHIVGVDTDGILANAQSFDSYGNGIQKIRSLLYEQLGLDPEESSLLPPRYQYLWRGTWRTCEILLQNVRELPLDSLRAQDPWRMVIDYPFDREGYTPRDDRAQVLKDLFFGHDAIAVLDEIDEDVKYLRFQLDELAGIALQVQFVVLKGVDHVLSRRRLRAAFSYHHHPRSVSLSRPLPQRSLHRQRIAPS
jgi:hypothetical protein